MNTYQNRVAIVTGGGSGIGRALCEALAQAGAEVVVTDIDVAKAETVARQITAAGGKARAAGLDVRDAAAFRALVEDVARSGGRIDYLFNNAGVSISGEVRDVTLDDWNHVLHVNVNGVVHGVHAVYPLMVAQGAGHIVNMASLAGLCPMPGVASYCASKHAIVGLSTCLRAEGAELGVRVSVVCPGFVDTPLLSTSRYVNIDRERALKMIPVKPIAPKECARAILSGVAMNQSLIVVTWQAKVLWLLQRWFPAALERIMLRAVRDFRKLRRESPQV